MGISSIHDQSTELPTRDPTTNLRANNSAKASFSNSNDSNSSTRGEREREGLFLKSCSLIKDRPITQDLDLGTDSIPFQWSDPFLKSSNQIT